MISICVFCGSSFNGDPLIKQLTVQLAEILVNRNITLVYGGAKIGLMGILADAVLQKGGKVIGVMPGFLMNKEVAHPNLTEMHIVGSMHERKQLMNDLCDGMITLPGGLGTLDEFFEALTWLQLGLHDKPIGLLNVNGFYDPLLKQLDVMLEQQYLKSSCRRVILTSGNITELIDLVEAGVKNR